jgi:hypothetical protein
MSFFIYYCHVLVTRQGVWIDNWIYWSVSRVNYYWPSPAQSYLVPSPKGLMTRSDCLTTLGVVQLLHLWDLLVGRSVG